MTAPSLPGIVPVFPLTGVLLLPGMELPLHIFEERYRNMVSDAREGAEVIGMIQPLVPRQDNSPPPEGLSQPSHQPSDSPVLLYPVGCLGRMTECRQNPDGGYLILLTGISRFRWSEELPLHRGYRRVKAGYGEFGQDITDPESGGDPGVTQGALLEGLGEYAAARRLEVDSEALGSLSPNRLVALLAMSLPFGPAEKQALLEAPDSPERARRLLDLMRFDQGGSAPDRYAPPTVN